MFKLKQHKVCSNFGLLGCALFLVFIPAKSEAKRGIGSLFKVGQGARAVNGVKNYSVNTLTLNQLESCLNLESEIEISEKY